MLNTYSYLPFGELIQSTGTTQNPFTYVGQQGVMNGAAGLYYMRNRWYDPSQGRFTQPDPNGVAGSGVNLYQYALNSPVRLINPSGQKTVTTYDPNGSSTVTTYRPDGSTASIEIYHGDGSPAVIWNFYPNGNTASIKNDHQIYYFDPNGRTTSVVAYKPFAPRRLLPFLPTSISTE